MRKILATGTLTGALVVGGVMGASLFLGTPSASAQDPVATAAPGASAAPVVGQDGTTLPDGGKGGGVDFGGDGFGHTAAIAKAIGITETELTTALQGGQTIAAIATAHNVDVQVVIDAYVVDENAEIEAAVTAGTLTPAQATTEKAGVAARGAAIVNGTGGFGGRGGHGGGVDFGGDGFGHTAAIAKAIGITETELTTALQGGQTIAAIATAHNVDVQVVIDAYVVDENAEIEAAVTAGTLTPAQATTEKAGVAARGAAIVNGTGGFGGRGGHGGRGGAPNGTAPNSATPDASASPTVTQ